jgi:protein STE50
LEDPAWKVLPAALKKYKINNDDWQNYAMFICYGSPGMRSFVALLILYQSYLGSRIERCLSYDEKPLLLFQKLKDAKKNPVFMLKHIKDIRSPIAVAQQKQAARKASSESPSTEQPRVTTDNGRAVSRPLKLQVHGASPAIAAGVNDKPIWSEAQSPSVEVKKRPDELPTTTFSSHGDSKPAANCSTDIGAPEQFSGATRGESVPSPPQTGLSYAVAIYPYMADQEDEFDVVV